MPEELKQAREASTAMKSKPQSLQPTVQVIKLEGAASDRPKESESNGVERADGQLPESKKVNPSGNVRCTAQKRYPAEFQVLQC